jgi:hypothetical protein
MKEPQKLTITVVFNVEHNPGNDKHLEQVLRSTLETKGLYLTEDNEIYV